MNILACFLVAAGGATGGGLRFLVSDAVEGRWGTGFPWGTLVVNVTGALLIGIVAGLARASVGIFSDVLTQDLIVTGLLGGYTTVSSFCLQTINLMLERQIAPALVNVIGSTVLCLMAVAAGYFPIIWIANH